MATKEIVLFTSSDGMVSFPVPMDDNTVWLSQMQMAELFDKDRSVINRHIKNAISEGEIEDSPQYANYAYCEKKSFGTKNTIVYSLDVIISVGYRVHSLVALTVMIAESRPEEKEMMVNLVMNFLA